MLVNDYPPMDKVALAEIEEISAVGGNYPCPWNCEEEAPQLEVFYDRLAGGWGRWGQVCQSCRRRWTFYALSDAGTYDPNAIAALPGWPPDAIPLVGREAAERN